MQLYVHWITASGHEFTEKVPNMKAGESLFNKLASKKDIVAYVRLYDWGQTYDVAHPMEEK